MRVKFKDGIRLCYSISHGSKFGDTLKIRTPDGYYIVEAQLSEYAEMLYNEMFRTGCIDVSMFEYHLR